MDKYLTGEKRSKFNRKAQRLHQLSLPDIQNQTNHLLRNCPQLESDLTLTVSTEPPRITSVNLLLNVTQVKSASLLLHVTEGTSYVSCHNKCQSPVQRSQIGSLLLHGTQVSSARLLLNITQATWLSLLLKAARSEVSCYTIHRSQVYVSC
jgi:hypothetical protein